LTEKVPPETRSISQESYYKKETCAIAQGSNKTFDTTSFFLQLCTSFGLFVQSPKYQEN